LALIGTAALPGFLSRAIAADQNASGSKRLVIIFQRGAADGLNIVVPHGESAYYDMRPTIAVPRGELVELDGFFGLHPAMRALKPMWDDHQLAIIHAAGSPDPTRSHFDAQDYMESGTPGAKSTADGWLNRALQTISTPADKKPTPRAPLQAIAMGASLPRILAGSAPAAAIDNVRQFGVRGQNPNAQRLADTFEEMYDRSLDTVLQGTAQETFDAVKALRAATSARYVPAAGANYPRGSFGDALRDTAQLIKAELGVRIAFADISGWDHHVNEGSAQGQLSNLLRGFSESIAAFWTDLGPMAHDTVLITMSEFGRTAHENGSRGTDHGHANVMLVLGGPVRGGKVYGRWPGLGPNDLHEGRDLALTTDFRTVLGEAVARHLGNPNLRSVFPGFNAGESGFLRLLG